MPRFAHNLKGRRFHQLTVLGRAPNTAQNKAQWYVRCDCGKIIIRPAADLKKSASRSSASCGCAAHQAASNRLRTHGMSRHPAFAVWRSMLDRCRLPTHQAWKNYGGRGIKVCTRWQARFEFFWSDMGPSYVRGLTLDRVNNDKGYNLENCRWTTRRKQCANKRGNRHVNTPWGRMVVSEAARRSGIGVTTLLYRLEHGVSESELFRKPDFTNRF